MLFLIALGGALGTAARWQLSHWFPTPAGGIPWVTLGINVVGSFILGLLARYFLTHATSPAVVAAMTVGLCGGFTTFSAFSWETLALLQNGEMARAGMNVIANVTACIIAAAAGVWLARQLI